MNSQLPPLPPPDPLDEEERGLARTLRGLPSSMPSPELDARILGASRRAIAIAPKPRAIRPRWVLGLSSAAVAVLAVGMLLKLHTQGRDQAIAPPTQAPAATHTAAAPTAADAAANAPAAAGTAATLPPSLPNAEAMAPIESAPVVIAAKAVGTLHAAAPPERDERQAAKNSMPAVTSAAAQAASNSAPIFAEPSPISQPSVPAAVAPSAAPTVSAAASQAVATPLAPAPDTAQMQASQEAVEARKAAALDRIDQAGAGLKDAQPVTLPAVVDDAKLPPAEWIQRIRARVNAADGDGARESLRRFIARYPNAEIPADLAPLRK